MATSTGYGREKRAPVAGRRGSERARVDVVRAGAATRARGREDSEWTFVKRTRDGIELRSSPAPASAGARPGVREILATCVLEDVDRESMWGAVCDLERYDEFVPYVVASEVAARRGRKTWSRADVRAPVADDRSYAIVIEETSVGNAGVNAATWRTTREQEGALKPGHRRMRANCGAWELRDGPGGKGTAVRYTLITDPGRGVPRWLLTQTPKTVPDVIRAFRTRALSGEWRAAATSKARGGAWNWDDARARARIAVEGLVRHVSTSFAPRATSA